MSWHTLARAVLIAAFQIVVYASGSQGADPPANDWLRGTGQKLELCLKGEVFDADGKAATDVQVTCGLNALDPQRVEAIVDGHRFKVWLPVGAFQPYSLWLKASSARSNHVAYRLLNAFQLRQLAIDGIKFTLAAPTRQVKVITTFDDQPVAGATVKAELGFGTDVRSQTDASGVARFDLLPDQKLSHLTAWTDDHRIGGFHFNRKPPRDPNDDEFTVELSKCRDQTMRCLDEQGSPVPDVELIIQMATPQPNVNYIGTNEHSRLRTDAAGEVVYRWFPDWKQHHYYPELVTKGWVIAGDPETSGTTSIFKLKKARPRKQVQGRVVSRNAAGFFIQVQSFQGEQDHRSDHLRAFTDSEGTFTVDVLPDARYCAYVLDAFWVGKIIDLTPYASALDQITAPELSVSAGQKVEVLVTSGLQNKPYSNLGISFRREYDYTWQENGKTQHGSGGPQWWATTDETGRATTRTLPGKLEVSIYSPQWRTEQTAEVATDKTTIVEFHREFEEKRTVKGRVVLSDDRETKPGDVDIRVFAVDGQFQDEHTLKSKKDGTFSCEILASQIGVFGSTRDGRLAGSLIVTDLDKPIELRLAPTSTYEGHLLTADGQPVVGRRVQAISCVETERRPGAQSLFEATRLETQTDENGNYTFRGLPGNLKVSLYAYSTDDSRDHESLGEILLKPGEARPRSVSRVSKITKKMPDAPLAERFQTTLRDCALGGFRPMVIISDDSGPIAEFVNTNFIDYEQNSDVYGFMQISIATSEDRLKPADAAFLKERNWQLANKGHVIAYALDAKGQELGKLEIDVQNKSASEAVANFIHQFAPPQVDAEEKWNQALAEAKRTNRRVWARVSQRYCGPCFRLARWLDDQRQLLEKDFVMLKIDDVRDQNGAKVAQRLTRGKEFSIPFFAIFDPDGALLIDSTGPLGNIGYPSGAEGKSHLRKMLLETRRNLTEADVEKLVESVAD